MTTFSDTQNLLYDSIFVFTAHCVNGRTASGIHLILGRVTLDGSGGINRQGFRIVTHPSFNAETMAFEYVVL